MKGIFYWFKDSSKMKRWIMLILVGIVFASFGMANMIVATEAITFMQAAKIIVYFVIGFTCSVIGLVYINKRNMELFIEATDDRMESDQKVNVNSLIFNKTVYNKGPKIVVIGGGSGLNTVLKGLKNYTSNITAIVTVSDYGKLPSNSRKQLDLLPLEDIKESLIALSYNEPVMEQILNFKFQRDNLKDLSFGDIYLYAMKEVYGDFTQSIEASKDVLNITGRVLPVTLDEIKICAELENGMIVEEKEKIPDIVFDKVTKINRIYINPTNCVPAPGVLEAIKNADAIVIGPGSLYTNVIPNLLVKNVSRTIKESKAIKIYVNNIMTEPGQTDNFSIADHLQAIIDHAGNVIDYCIYDTGEIVPEYVRKYNRQGQDLVEQDIQKAKEKGIKLLQRNLSTIIDDNIRHSPKAVAEAIIQIICDDLKYRDMQNDPQYIMLNSRLKEEKKFKKHTRPIQKTKQEKTKTKSKAKHEKRTSKFAAKYQERIKSIQESDEQKIKNQMRMKKNNTEEYK